MKIKIAGRDFKHFTELSIQRQLDSIASTFSFKVRFNPENDDHKELFKPLQYHKVEIFNGKNRLILTGTILNHAFDSDEKKNLATISGYSLAGILDDVTIPLSQYPLESTGRSLKDIAQKLCGAFGIGLIIDPSAANSVGQIYETTTASATDTIKGYLAKLTTQKNVLLSHDVRGNVVIFKPNDQQKPRYFFNKGNSVSMSSVYDGQGLHSHISCIRQPSDDNEGVSTEDTIKNPLIGKYRPTTKVLSSGEDVDTSNAANHELAAELKAISIKVNLKGLFDDIDPGEIVNIHNHELYSFAYSRYMVASVSLTETETEDKTTLDLVLSETFTGKVPKNILFYYESHKRHI